jgi:BioD-like phosphotransacetylase family protein
MVTLYIVSTESFSGKTSLCLGLATRKKRDGLRVGYFKPLVFYGRHVAGRNISEDAPFMRVALGLSEPDDVLAPNVLDTLAIENAIAGKPNEYVARIERAFAQISAEKDVVVVEGAATLVEGTLLGLPPGKLAELLDARVLAVAKYTNDLALDRVIAGQQLFGDRLLGVVLNEVPRPRMEFVEQAGAAALRQRGLDVYATLPQERLLLSMTVNEIAEVLDADIIGPSDRGNELVENLMVGAMSMESALSYFRRKPNKAVLTGGDRADIQLAALETSTRCLVLTGNLRPSPLIQGRAEELGVPLIIAKQDTLSAVEIIQQYFGKIRLHQPRKVERLEALLNERFDFARLYASLGLSSKSR